MKRSIAGAAFCLIGAVGLSRAAGPSALSDLREFAAVREMPPAPPAPSAADAAPFVVRMDAPAVAGADAPLCGFSSYSDAEREFEATESRRFSMNDLLGRWRQVAVAAVSWDFAGITPVCGSDGVENADGSDHDIIVFKAGKNPDGSAGLAADQIGLGSSAANQAGLPARWNPFDNWVYVPTAAYFDRAPWPIVAHFNHECRIAADDGSSMLCAVRLVISPDSVPRVDSSQSRFNQEIGMYLRYQRL